MAEKFGIADEFREKKRKIENDDWYDADVNNIEFISDEDMIKMKRSRIMPTGFS